MQEENCYVRMERRRNNDRGPVRQNAKERMAFPGRKNANSSGQVTPMVLGKQMGRVDKAYLKYRSTLQEIKAKIECCENEDCSGTPAKIKTTVCPTGVEQITQLEFTPDGSHILFGTTTNRLYLLDVRKLKNLEHETVVTSKKEVTVTEFFKIIPKLDKKGCLQEITEVFGVKPPTRPGCTAFVRGIHCLEFSPSGLKILTSGHKSNQLKVIEVDESRKKGGRKEVDRKALDYNESEAWTKLGVLTETARNHGIGKITGGTWVNDNVTATTDAVGTLKVCRIHSDKILVPADHRLHFPTHALPVEGGQAFPRHETLSTLVNVDKLEMRDEFIVTAAVGEIYILKADEKLGITSRGVRREGIPNWVFHFTEQRKETKLLCQTIDKTTGTVVVGTLSGISFLDTRAPHLLEHVKLWDAKRPKELRRREMDQGEPISIVAQDNIVSAGLYSGYVIFYDLRNKKWILEEEANDQSARVTWAMGIQESHERKNMNNPNNYPLLNIKRHNSALAVGGGPVYGNTARTRGLEGVLTLWE